MIETSADSDGIFIKVSKPRSGFTGVEDLCLRPFHLIHVLSCQGGNPTHSLKKIQGHSLRGENALKISRYLRENRPSLCFPTIGKTTGDGYLSVPINKGLPENIDARHDDVRLCQSPRRACLFSCKDSGCCNVSVADVFSEGCSNQSADDASFK